MVDVSVIYGKGDWNTPKEVKPPKDYFKFLRDFSKWWIYFRYKGYIFSTIASYFINFGMSYSIYLVNFSNENIHQHNTGIFFITFFSGAMLHLVFSILYFVA